MEKINYIKNQMKHYKVDNSLVIIPKEHKQNYEIIHIENNTIQKLNYNIELVNKKIAKQIDKYTETINNIIEFIILKNNDKLLSNISHEINTSLNCITNTVELLENNNKNNNKAIELIYKQSLKLNLYFKNLINYFHFKTKKVTLKIEKYNIKNIIEYIKNYFNDEFNTILFKVKLDEKINDINIDKKKIVECLIILIDNSIKFKSDLIYLNIYTKHNLIYFSILDNGLGIKNSKYIFEPFCKENEHLEGLGLGLTNFKSLVKIMNGNIYEIKNNLFDSKGLAITFYIKNNSLLNYKKEKKDLKEVNKLLIIEDNIINSNLLKIMLKKINIKFKINIINDSRLVEKHLLNNTYDKIFLDLKMPFINGFEILKKLDKIYNNKVIIITALLDENKVSDLVNNNLVNKIIYKPIKIIDLKIP